ncbi:MAG: TetR/AcrR family transcriptional regulator [Polyangiales bacterium]
MVTKGEATRVAILGEGLSLASRLGLEGLSLAPLAERVGMSKSGLFAHFRSKEALQLAVLEEASARFVARVVVPALRAPRGRPRVESLFERWIAWSHAEFMPGGCIFVQAMIDLDPSHGVVWEKLVETQRDWLDVLAQAVRISVAEGHLAPDTDAEQVAHEIVTLAFGHHLVERVVNPDALDRTRRAFMSILDRHAA